ncbi:sensor histidine kinase YesM [Paenibacillus marchantiophytorum]|uniref:Sensor histidine kinase YesM n=1 Tax=Paenibacillus marchantiophytorum TaxID=1619310 RepID=A0ABQ1FJW8_9BACL|nr:histidine kinase [Paenibacillus marchantiophytorum]GGA16975.1 sensor histidine kinase YesM [Paenibacillus marchantiophytorum]
MRIDDIIRLGEERMTLMQHLKIKHKLFVFILAGVIASSGLAWLFVQQSHKLYEQIIYREASDKFYLFSERMEEKLREIDKLSLSIFSDPEVQADLKTMKISPATYEAFEAANKLKRKLLTYHQSDFSVSSITILDATGNLLSAGVNAASINDGNKERFQNLGHVWGGASVWVGGEEQQETFYAVRDIREIAELSLERLGTLMIGVEAPKVVYASSQRHGNYDSELMITSGDRLLFTSNHDLPLPVARRGDSNVVSLNGKSYLAAQFTLAYTGWTFIHFISYDAVFSHVNMMKNVLLGLYVLLAVVLLWLGMRFSLSMTRPLEALTQRISLVEKGNFEIGEPFYPVNRDELSILNRNFDKMTERLDALIKENYVKQIQLKEAEYEALKAKVNPHFLYNTLDSIHWMAKGYGHGDLARMVKALGDMLRSTIRQKEFVTLREELAHLRNYVTIQQFRFEERLSYQMDIPEELLSLHLPWLILQPVVENCMKYGVDAATGRCEITLTAELEADRLALIIQDKGPGMANPLDRDESAADEPVSDSTGIGLSNIHDRIQLWFGDTYGIRIEQGRQRGAVIRIEVPILPNPPGTKVKGNRRNSDERL